MTCVSVSVIDRQSINAAASLLPEGMEEELLSGISVGFVAAAGNEAAGTLVFALEGEELRIRWLYVCPDHRRKGIGTALMEELLSRALRFPGLRTVFGEYGTAPKDAGTEELTRFLENFVFRTREAATCEYRFPIEQVRLPESAFGFLARRARALEIRELGSLSPGERLLAGRHLRRNGYLLQSGRGIDWSRYDGKLSLFCMKGQVPLGLLLAKKREAFYDLTDLYAGPDASKLVILLLAEFLDRIRACKKGPREIRVMAVTQESQRLLERLVPGARRRIAYRSEFEILG